MARSRVMTTDRNNPHSYVDTVSYYRRHNISGSCLQGRGSRNSGPGEKGSARPAQPHQKCASPKSGEEWAERGEA